MSQKQAQPPPKRYPGAALIAAALLALLAGAAWYFLFGGAYGRMRAESLATRGEALFEAGTFDAAEKAAADALALDRDNLRAWRLLLSLQLHRANPSMDQVLLLRSRIADLAPADTDNIEQLAAGALISGRSLLAATATGDLLRHEGETPRALELAARLDYAVGRMESAEGYARKLLARAPDNPTARLIVAAREIESPDAATSDAAARTLEQLFAVGPIATQAGRALCRRALRRGDDRAARAWAEKVAALPTAEFDDHLILADIGVQDDPATAPDAAKHLAALTRGNASAMLALAGWLEKIRREDLLDALAAEPAAYGINASAAAIARARSLLKRAEWETLAGELSGADWGHGDALRLAYLARAYRELGRNPASRVEWAAAVRTASEEVPAAKALADLVRSWPGWETDYEELLWAALEKSPAHLIWSTRAIFEHYTAKRSAAGLLRISRAMLKVEPGSDAIQNNVAFLTLLREPPHAHASAHATATSLYARFPSEPSIASTYAISRVLQKKSADAVAAMQALPEPVRESPEIAPTYALALAAAGRIEEGRRAIATVDRTTLFPEMRALLEKNGL